MYKCRVERHSVGPQNQELVSFIIQYPRVVLAEVVTHRTVSDTWGTEFSYCERATTKDMSKNSASSRAIPYERFIKRIKDDPYMPQWTLNQKGMQGEFVEDQQIVEAANREWLSSRDIALESAKWLSDLGIHKQDCNRLLEPWAWVTQIVTCTGKALNNFFALRCHKAAHPAFQKIARMMYLAKRKSTPVRLEYGEWHLPFIPLEDQMKFFWRPCDEPLPNPIRFSAARCAWLSYENHEKDGTPEAMLRTYDRLLAEVPVHASPVEHQATPWDQLVPGGIGGPHRSNFQGWIQARKLLKMENITEFNPSEEEIKGWGIDESKLWVDEE